MILHFTTESGAHYEWDQDNHLIRRQSDGVWRIVYATYPQEPIIGQRLGLVLGPLYSDGSDQTQLTTAVTKVWEEVTS